MFQMGRNRRHLSLTTGKHSEKRGFRVILSLWKHHCCTHTDAGGSKSPLGVASLPIFFLTHDSVFTVYLRTSLNFWSFCLHFLSTKILCITTPSLCAAGDGTHGFLYARETLYQLSYKPSPLLWPLIVIRRHSKHEAWKSVVSEAQF